MKILLIAVNYNSYKELRDYLGTIECAAGNAGDCQVDVAIADNTVESPEIIAVNYKSVDVTVYPFYKNYGYLGGATKVLEDIGKDAASQYDYVIISNVDVKLSTSFFQDLAEINCDGVGWVVPSVIRLSDNSNENPFMIKRPSKAKLRLLCVLYSFSYLFYFYSRFVYKFIHSKKNRTTDLTNREIYAGMGSIIITSGVLAEKYFPYRFPAFMYGEEIYFAEIVRNAGLKTVFRPKITVYDICGVSTGRLGIRRKCRMMKSGIAKMLEVYYK